MRQWKLLRPSRTRTIDASDFQIVCNGIMWAHGHDRLLATLESVRRHKSDDRLLLSIEGIAYLRSSQLELARRHWIRFWERVRDDPGFARQRAATLPHWTAAASTFFDVATRRDEPSSDLSELNFCVYTALFGEYDELRSPTYLPSGLRFICFSDRPRDVPGWEVRIVEADLPNPAMNNRRLKLLPFELLEDYDQSLYIDANLVLLADPLVVYREWLKDRPFVAWSSPTAFWCVRKARGNPCWATPSTRFNSRSTSIFSRMRGAQQHRAHRSFFPLEGSSGRQCSEADGGMVGISFAIRQPSRSTRTGIPNVAERGAACCFAPLPRDEQGQ